MAMCSSRIAAVKTSLTVVTAGLLFLCPDSVIASSQNTPAQTTGLSEARCGQTYTDALNAAHAALASNDHSRDRAALVCLLAAVSALHGEMQALEKGEQHSGVIKVPQHSDANQRGP